MESCIHLSNDMIRKLNAIRLIVDKFAGLSFESDSEYIEFLLSLAIHKILNDVLSDPDSRLDLVKILFNKYPEDVAKAIADLLEGGIEHERRETVPEGKNIMYT